MRKFFFNTGVLGAIAGGWGVIRRLISGPRDVRLLLQGISWLAGIAVAVIAVVNAEKDKAEEEQRQLEAQSAKSAKKSR